MSIYGQTKGTELEKVVKNIMQAEANGTDVLRFGTDGKGTGVR